MAIDARPFLFKASRGGSSAALTAILAVAAVGGGVYFATHRPQRPVVRDNDTMAEIAALARAEKDTEWLQRAIRERQAILGMTRQEVENAKGPPRVKQRFDALSGADRTKGGVEKWVYSQSGAEEATVLFGAKGLVIHSSDVGDGQPGQSQAIRR